GDNVEDALGHLRFLAFYLMCGVVAGLTHTYMLPTSRLPLIGASGAVAGVIGAYLMLHPRVMVWVLALRFIPLKVPAAWVLGVWIATQVVMVLMAASDQVAWWAHIGGAACGAILIVVMRRPGVALFGRRRERRPDRVVGAAIAPQSRLPNGCPKCRAGCPIDTQLLRPYASFRTCEATISRRHNRDTNGGARAGEMIAVQHGAPRMGR